MRIASLLTMLLVSLLAAPTSPASGKEMFRAYCASCHGLDGKTQAGHGSKDMPVWGPILSTVSADSPAVVTQRVGNLVGFIESIQVK